MLRRISHVHDTPLALRVVLSGPQSDTAQNTERQSVILSDICGAKQPP